MVVLLGLAWTLILLNYIARRIESFRTLARLHERGKGPQPLGIVANASGGVNGK